MTGPREDEQVAHTHKFICCGCGQTHGYLDIYTCGKLAEFVLLGGAGIPELRGSHFEVSSKFTVSGVEYQIPH